jgi:hypothetical protein
MMMIMMMMMTTTTAIMLILNKQLREELIAYCRLIRHGPQRKQSLQQLFFVVGTCLLIYCLATVQGYTDRATDSLFI